MYASYTSGSFSRSVVYFTVLNGLWLPPLLDLFLADRPVNCFDCWLPSWCQSQQFATMSSATLHACFRGLWQSTQRRKHSAFCFMSGCLYTTWLLVFQVVRHSFATCNDIICLVLIAQWAANFRAVGCRYHRESRQKVPGCVSLR